MYLCTMELVLEGVGCEISKCLTYIIGCFIDQGQCMIFVINHHGSFT